MSLDYDPRRDLLQAFATPIAKMRLRLADEINPALKALILEAEAAGPGQTRSNVGGWHSADDFFEWPGAEVEKLRVGVEDGGAPHDGRGRPRQRPPAQLDAQGLGEHLPPRRLSPAAQPRHSSLVRRLLRGGGAG